MTLRMAAGQQKKRLLSSTLCEQYRGKKKKRADSSDCVLNLNSHIVLELDNRQKRAVAKREQIAIRWKDVAPFLDPVPHNRTSLPHNRTSLAGVLSVPREIFGLVNLTEVLSYEVWATCLSEAERKLLSQFLPSGVAVEQVVQSLLMGENHHFGNPLINWSEKLCSGSLHPDEALHTQKQLKANKKAYYRELEKYHTNMLGFLKNWKEEWVRCQDPEKFRQAFTNNKGCLPVSTEKNKTLSVYKKDLPQKLCVRYGDAAKHMSYIKISKKQHDLIKGMKQSGDGIHSKSLNHVLGDIKSFHVESYEEFEEEEKKRLHEHWLQVAKSNVPVAYEDWSRRKMQKGQWSKSLKQELLEKITPIHAKTVETSNVEGPSNSESSSHQSLHVSDPQEDDSNADFASDSNNHSHLEIVSRASDPETDCYLSEKTVLDRIPCLSTHLDMDPSLSSVQQDTIYSSENMDLGHIPSLNNHMEIEERVSDGEAAIYSSGKSDVGCIPSSSSHQEMASRVSDQEAGHYSSENTDAEHVTSVNGHLENASRVSDQEADQRASGKPDLERSPSLNHPSQFSLEKTDNFFKRRDPAEDYHDMGAEDIQKPIDDSFGKTNSSQVEDPEIASHHILQPRDDLYEHRNSQIDVMGLQPMSSAKEIWQRTVSARDSYYRFSPHSHVYSGNLPLRKSEDVGDQTAAPIIDLERDILEQRHRESISSSMPVNSCAPIFPSYANHNHNDMLPSLSKGPELLPSSYSLPHLNGLKESGMQFLMADGSLSGSGHFSNQFQERQGYQEQKHLRQIDIYMKPMIDNNSINSGGFQSVERQNLSAVESSLHASISSNNWFSGDYGARNSWLQQQFTNNGGQQGLGDGGGSDGSLFSVLSSCKMVPPRSSPRNTTRSDQFVMPRNRVSGEHPMSNENIYSFISNRLIGSSSHEAATTTPPPSMKVNNHLSWLSNLPHQSGDVNDLSGAQFPRPWEQ